MIRHVSKNCLNWSLIQEGWLDLVLIIEETIFVGSMMMISSRTTWYFSLFIRNICISHRQQAAGGNPDSVKCEVWCVTEIPMNDILSWWNLILILLLGFHLSPPLKMSPSTGFGRTLVAAIMLPYNPPVSTLTTGTDTTLLWSSTRTRLQLELELIWSYL